MSRSLDKSCDFFNYSDEILTCSISQAIRQDDKRTLQIILNKRRKTPKPLSADNRKWTALHVAASQSEYKECLEMVLRFGDSVLIDLDAETFEGETALFIACERGCHENALILLKHGCDLRRKKLDGTSPLHVAAMKGYSQIVDSLLDYQTNVNDQDWQKFTPLHLAAMNGFFEVCRVLLENKASVCMTDSDGNIPLHLACQNGYIDIIRLLLEYDFNSVNYQNYRGITPLMLAVQNQDVQCVRYLLENDAKTEICNADKVISLQFAATSGKKDILQLVLQSTDVISIEEYCLYNSLNILSSKGIFHSLSCCAIRSGSVDCLSVLLESKLSKSVLEAPYVDGSEYILLDVFSPLAYLFSIHSELDDDIFNSFLDLLLKYNIIYTKEFSKVLNIKWPESNVKFMDPFSIIFSNEWSNDKKLYYFHLLNSNGVTPDYCLQCFKNNHENFKHFNNVTSFFPFYTPVLNTVLECNIEATQLFLMHSSILEPDVLCHYFRLSKSCLSKVELYKNKKPIRSMYKFLTELKPSYYNYQRSRGCLFCAFPTLFSSDEEFSQSNLQQLCRTVIRDQLRGITLEDNLLHFRHRILQLPLPSTLIDYLLFKS